MANLSINKNVKLKLSLEWIKRSFVTFREYPVQFIILGIFTILIIFLPFLGAFLTPLFVAQFMVLLTKVENHQGFKVSEIFNGFFSRRSIVRLAFINFCLSAIIVMAQYLVETNMAPNISSEGVVSISTSLFTVVFMLLMLLLQVAMWLSPIICLKHDDVSPREAMWWSLKATFYNVPTLFIFSILVIAITLLSVLPVGLGLLVWIPILNITSYYVYYSLFTQN